MMFGRRRKRDKTTGLTEATGTGETTEVTASGQPILRHEPVERTFEAPAFDEGVREAVEAHVEAHLGESNWVWHELVSDLVHIDVYVWAPTDDRPMYTLMTSGMSDLPMTVPDNLVAQGASQRAEMMICLPPDWPMPTSDAEDDPWKDDDNYFPIRSLKMLARLPHDYNTWLGVGHTIPNGDPPEPFSDATKLTTWLTMPPMTMPPSFASVDVEGVGTVEFLSMFAIYNDELQLKLDEGTEALIPGFEAHRVTELLDLDRPSSLSPS